MGVSQSQILAINLNGSKAIDFQKEALANNNSVPLDAGESKHNILRKKLSLKSTGMTNNLKNSDDLYKTVLKLKKTGMLKDMLARAGITKKYLSEDGIGGMGGIAGSGPIASFGNSSIMLKNSYPNNGGLGTSETSKSKIKKEEIINEAINILKNKGELL
jgi:hypothetical protein